MEDNFEIYSIENIRNESEIKFIGNGSTEITADCSGFVGKITPSKAPIPFDNLEDAQDKFIKDIEDMTGIDAPTVNRGECEKVCVNYDVLRKMLNHETDAKLIEIDRLHMEMDDLRIFYIVPICTE